MSRPLVTLYCIVEGPIYERYWAQLEKDATRFFLPGDAEIVTLPGIPRPDDRQSPPMWSHISATRYEVALANMDRLRGDYIFQIDADMRIVAPIGRDILCEGITTSLHPGIPDDQPAAEWPYERNPLSRACVPFGGEGPQYHPGCFVGGSRDKFVELATYIAENVRADLDSGLFPAWYEESHLNRWYVDRPADLVLPKEYCWWAYWTVNAGDHAADPEGAARKFAEAGAKIVHIDKTGEEFELRG